MASYIILVLIIYCTHYTISASNVCKCKPGSSCWPDENTWQSLNTSIQGRLLSPKPYGWPCHAPQYNPAACRTARQFSTNPYRREDVPGAMQYPNWEAGFNSSGCPLGKDGPQFSPCYQGQVSTYAVDVAYISDIQTAIFFARLRNVRLVVKSTGHDWLGRSTAAGSLCLWLHHLTAIEYHDTFLPEGCPGTSTEHAVVTAASGATWTQVYEFVDQRGRVIVGPMGSSLSAAGGFVQGGGHGPLSRLLGLAADNVLQFQVVTADGVVRIANRCQNRDLFWALSGGGGGTFGVVISASYRTFPALALGVTGISYAAASTNSEGQRDLIQKFITVAPSMNQARLAGYFHIETNNVTLTFLLPNGTHSAATNAFSPLVSYVDQHPLLSTLKYTVTVYDTFLRWHRSVLCETNPGVCTDLTGMSTRLATRFIPARIFQEEANRLTDTLMEILYGRGFSFIDGLFVVGGAVSDNAKFVNNSLSLFWRQSLWHLSLNRTWNEGTPVEEQQEIGRYLSETNDLLRSITPGWGCYKNEADYLEENWQEAFFGEKYTSLKAVKESVDPAGLFMCWKCVGSESWMAECASEI